VAIAFVIAALFHAGALIAPDIAEPSPPWRHALFIGINLALAAGFFRRPRFFLWVFLVVTAQQLVSHGMQGWRVWQEGRIDWASVVVCVALPPLAALLAWDRKRVR